MKSSPFLIIETGQPFPTLRRYGRFPHWIRVAAGLEASVRARLAVQADA